MGLCNNVDGEDGEALFTNMIQPKLPLAMFTEIPPSEIPSGGGEQWLTAEVLWQKSEKKNLELISPCFSQ